MGKRASRLSFAVTAILAIGVPLQGCSSASDAEANHARAPVYICQWSCVRQYRMSTTCTELTPETTTDEWTTECIDNTACEQLPFVPSYDDPDIPCGSSMQYQNSRDYIGSCDDWQAAGSPVFTVAAKWDGASCEAATDCFSNHCVAFRGGDFVCVDPCTMGGCSAGFACKGGYCFPTQAPTAGSLATRFDGDYCDSDAVCLSGHCLTQPDTTASCVDRCASNQCSQNFTCIDGDCVFACPPLGT